MYKLQILSYHGGKSPWSFIISLFSNSTHVALLVNDFYKSDIDLLRGSSIGLLNWNKNNYTIEKTYLLTDGEYEIVIEYIHKNINQPYSLYENIRYLIYKFTKVKLEDDLYRKNCIEYVQDLLVLLSKIQLNNTPMSPDEFIKYIKK